MKSMTGLFHEESFFRTWWIIEPKDDGNYDDHGMVMPDQPRERDFKYWTEHGFEPIHVVEREAYSKCLLDLNEMTAKYNFMAESAQQNAKERDEALAEANKYKNVYSAEAVTSLILAEQMEDMQNKGIFQLWGLTTDQVLSLMKFYEATTGNKAQSIK